MDIEYCSYIGLYSSVVMDEDIGIKTLSSASLV